MLKINSVEMFNEIFRFEPSSHPLITLNRINGDNVSYYINEDYQVNLYSIVMKDGVKGISKYGWREYDFSKGLMNFFAPGQSVMCDEQVDLSSITGWLLVFHSDFLSKYPLSKTITKYKFFSYETNEALFVSNKERKILEAIFENINAEINTLLDENSQDIIISYIESLLSYAKRFYTRQFRTRSSVEFDFVVKVETVLNKLLENNSNQLINPNCLASELSMSVSYLSDTLRNLTGMNSQQFIHNYLIKEAKNILLTTEYSINEISYMLGFEYPQYFNRLFKQKTGLTPSQFKNSN